MIDTKDFIKKSRLNEVAEAANLLSEYFSKSNRTEKDLAELRRKVGEIIEQSNKEN